MAAISPGLQVRLTAPSQSLVDHSSGDADIVFRIGGRLTPDGPAHTAHASAMVDGDSVVLGAG